MSDAVTNAWCDCCNEPIMCGCQEAAQDAENHLCLKQTYQLCRDGEVQRAMELVFTRVHALLRLGRFGTCDALLDMFDPTECPAIVGVGVLRACAPVRDQLSNWSSLMQRVEVAQGETSRCVKFGVQSGITPR